MLEIEALEREADKQKAPNFAHDPALALGDSEDDEDDEEDADEVEQVEGQKERPVRLTNHTCELFFLCFYDHKGTVKRSRINSVCLCLSGAEAHQQDVQENEDHCDVPPSKDWESEEASRAVETHADAPPEEQPIPEKQEEAEKPKETEDADENEETRDEEETDEEESTPSQKSEPELNTSQKLKEQEPDEEKETKETKDKEEHEYDEDDDEEEDEEEEEEVDDDGQDDSSKDREDASKINGHVITGQKQRDRLSPPGRPHMCSASPLLCPLVESEISTTDRDASDASYELFNGKTTRLTNGSRHRGTTPRYPDLPLDPQPNDFERDAALTLTVTADRSRTVSSSSTGETPKGQHTHRYSSLLFNKHAHTCDTVHAVYPLTSSHKPFL